MRIATYLKFNGKCEEALNTYKELFNAEQVCLIRYNESFTENKTFIGKVFHAELKIKEFFIYMSDTEEELEFDKQVSKITVECDTLQDAEKYYNALLEGGIALMPFGKVSWGDYMGHVRDAFGVTWYIVFSA